MVFEAVVSSQLNKFLGAYIENLNSSQLKLGLLGGDVVLNKLVLKQSALDDFNLPVKTVAGHIDELVLKIPWTNIYAARTQVCIKGLYLLAIPNQAVNYDAVKERIASKEAKERQLALIEEAKARETEDKANPQENDGFVAKLAAQILQNLLVTVEDVHIRFEDSITYPDHPFAFGVTLKKIALESTDSSWIPTLISEPSKQFFKLLSLECLSVYWLSNTKTLLSKMKGPEQVDHFRKGIANAHGRPYEDSYIAGPITSYAKLRINTRPELDGSNYTIPKIFLNLTMEEISMGLSPDQYNDIVGFLSNIERMNRGSPYRKYRPVIKSYKNYAKIWWLFAYQCILEENVRRRRRNWRWSHMKQHRDLVHRYISLYKTKLGNKKEDLKLKKSLEELEDNLDVFNITLARRQAEVQVERIRTEQRIKDEAEAQQGGKGWFSGWFGRGASSSSTPEDADSVVKSLQAEMTPAEKAKLYSAIGYEENAVPAIYPKTFVENHFEFYLKSLAILLHDPKNAKQPVILLTSLSRVEATVEQRPIAQALQVSVKVGDFVIDGSPHDEEIPSLVRPLEANKEILNFVYETNPLDESCDQRIRLSAEPLLITYDVNTLKKTNVMFESKEASQLTQITAAARQKLEDLKKTSALGLEYAIQNHAVVDVDVNIKGSYLILPYEGCLQHNRGKILCNMGNFSFKSVPTRKRNEAPRVSQLMRVGSTEQDILDEMLSHSYDKFSLGLRDVQIISVLPNENWSELVKNANPDFFILKPMSIELVVEKCLLLDDPRLPKLKVSGQLPSIHVDLLDTRLVNMAAVLKSIPSPTPEGTLSEVAPIAATEVDLVTHTNCDDSALEHLENAFKVSNNEEIQLVQATELMLRFEFQEVRLSLSVVLDDNLTKPVLSFGMEKLGLVCAKKTFETVVDLTLKDLSLNFVDHLAKKEQDKSIKMINSSDSSKELLSVRFVDVNKQSPEFRVRHKSVLRKLEVVISSIVCDFHQEAVIDLLQLSNDINSRIDNIISVQPPRSVNSADAETALKNQPSKILAAEDKEKKRRDASCEDVDFQLNAQFNHFRVNMLTRNLRLTEITISGLELDMAVRTSYIVFQAGLDEFRIANPNGDSLYREIASVVDGRAIQLEVKIFNNATEDVNLVDMKKVDLAIHLKMSRMKAVYLSSFVRDLLAFINHFQAAKEALIEASSAAATAAKENMQKVYVQATRILLDIEFQAPYIIVPQRSNSTDALIIDLGHFTLKNQFDLRNVRNEIGSPAIMDSISLNLQELRIFLAVVDGMKVKSERELIEPLTFNLDLVRNLTSTWYNDEPDLKVDAQLGKVSLVVSEYVYGKLMQIVFDNLEEGQSQLMEIESPELKDREVSQPTGPAQEKPTFGESPLLSSQSSELSVDSILQRYGPARVSVAFVVKLDEIKMELFTNAAPKNEMTFTSTMERPLSKLAILGFKVSGQLMSDLSIRSKVTLHSFLIEDTRPLLQSSSTTSSPTTPSTPSATSKRLIERPFNRLLHPTESGSNPQQQMLMIDFQQDKQQDSKVDVHLCGFTLILCPTYLLRLLNFFTSGLPKSKSTQQSLAKPNKVTPSSSSPAASSRAQGKKHQSVSLMSVTVRVDKPDIFLVDRIDCLDTSALVLNFEMRLTLLMLPQALDVSGEISKLHIYSCVFDPAHRQGTMATVLSPCWLAVKAKLCEDQQASQVDINIGDVTLSVSPGTIALLTSVSKSMALTQDDTVHEEGDEENKEMESTSWSNLWEMKPLAFFNFPFLETEVGVEAHELVHDDNLQVTSGTKGTRCRNEQMIVVLNHFEMMIETGQGNRTSPLVLLESSMSATVKNWSSFLEIVASLNLQAGYYNSRLALWEPLLEPVDCTRLGAVKQRPWEMTMKMNKVVDDTEEFEFENRPLSKMEIIFESSDTMEVTVTRSFLEVVSLLGKAFSDAVNQKLSKRDTPASLYIVHNLLDKNLVVNLQNCDFTVDDASICDAKELILESGSKIGLKLKQKIRARSVLSELENENERLLSIQIPELSYSHDIPVSRSNRRFLPAGRSGRDESIGVIADICNDFGFRSITFRGVVQIHNHFQQPIDVYYMTKTGNEVNGVGRVEECGVLNVPLFALYTPTGELFFSPLGYGVSIVPFVWRDLQRQNPISKVLQCSSRHSGTSINDDPFFMQVTGNVEHIYMEDTRRKTLSSFCYEIHLRPTVILHNSLPVPLYILTCGAVKELIVPAGASRYLSSVEPGAAYLVMKMKNYLERDWACKEEIRPMPTELSVWSFISYDGSSKATLDLGVFSTVKDQTVHMTVYCPFWMINNTGLLLAYKHSGKSSKKAKVRKSLKGEEDNCTYHPENMTDPVLFSFRPKSFFEKKTATIRVEDSNWSDRFSLDVAGSSGLVTCKTEEGDFCYQLGVTVQLSHEGLTKQVIFTPYYIISNLAPFDVDVYEVREVGPRSSAPVHRDWTAVGAGQSVPLWPRCPQKWLIFRVANSKEETLALSLDNPQATLLRLDNNYGGLFIDFQVSESSIIIVCHPYEDGRAPLMLVNHSSIPVSISESNDGLSCLDLAPHHACYYTWRQPNGARSLTWGSGGFKREFGGGRDVMRSASGSFDSPAGSLEWISFLHGRQRVLLFTDDKMLAFQQRSVSTSEPVEQSVTLSLHGLGISLVDNVNRREILYAGITSSGVIWETAKMNMVRPIYRAMSIRHNMLLEEAYQQYSRNLAANSATSSRRELDGGRLLVDLKELKVYKPKERLLRRSYRSGLEVLFEQYCNRRLIHARLNKLQIDNQLEDCVFPVVFAPVPPPRSMATESIPHPFMEISIVELLGQQTLVQQYEYFKLLVQECHFRVDMSLLNGVGSLFVNENDLQSELEHRKSVEMDIQSARQGLHERTRLLNDKAPENYFKMLHLSPLKIHLSFSNTGSGSGPVGSSQPHNNPASQLLKLVVQSVGVSLTEVQDVVFRLGFFERSDIFLSWQQLARDLQWHYTGQAVKQFYVLVFGLDVIGNPFGLALGISQGVEQLFYEPFQGAIQGPGEFVEGLALGARSLIGHTVGGVAGAASRIAGTLGKGLSYLTFDEDYQKNRRETLLRRPNDIGENLALGGKGLLMGVVEGVSGVVMRPIEGAQQQGVGGFFAGIGKGVVGLVTRPTAAIADFASGSLDAMKKAADVNEELSRLRPPRFLHPDGIVRPYIHYQAVGDCLLKALDKGRFSRTDHYVDHAMTETKATLLVTDRRVVLMSLDLFGQWQVEWAHTWEELTEPPQPNPHGLYIPLRSNKKVLGLFTSSESGKLVAIQSQEKCEMIRRKVEKLMKS